MKFAAGYQLPDDDERPFSETIAPYSESLREVYFPWLDTASGRSPIATRRGYTDWTAQARLEEDLRNIKRMGIKLDLLFNANCYGRLAISEELRAKVASIIEHLEYSVGGVDVITTTSPFIAQTVKDYFPEIEVRASVNMWIGTISAMDYMADIFDSFYVQREYNRDLEYIAELKEWADANGKGLYILANSGCFSYCTSHTFHDNLVAHENEICETKNVEDFSPYVCHRQLENRDNWYKILTNSWIRPEDVHNYEGLVPMMKLATRQHSRPTTVIAAYVNGSFRGNLVDLCEPGYGKELSPYIIDNKLLPDDFFEVTSKCKRRCHKCDYCKNALKKALVCLE